MLYSRHPNIADNFCTSSSKLIVSVLYENLQKLFFKKISHQILTNGAFISPTGLFTQGSIDWWLVITGKKLESYIFKCFTFHNFLGNSYVFSHRSCKFTLYKISCSYILISFEENILERLVFLSWKLEYYFSSMRNTKEFVLV